MQVMKLGRHKLYVLLLRTYGVCTVYKLYTEVDSPRDIDI